MRKLATFGIWPIVTSFSKENRFEIHLNSLNPCITRVDHTDQFLLLQYMRATFSLSLYCHNLSLEKKKLKFSLKCSRLCFMNGFQPENLLAAYFEKLPVFFLSFLDKHRDNLGKVVAKHSVTILWLFCV